MSALDMSVLCEDWTPTVTDRETVASMPLDKELTLAVSLRSDERTSPGRPPTGTEDGDARTLILSAFVDEVVLFELRFWDGRLVFQAGTHESEQGGHLIYGVDHFDFQVSFNPPQGGLAVATSWVKPSGGNASQVFTSNISNLKLPKAKYYTLRLGAPKHFVDLSLLGWRVNATYDLAPPACALPGICCPPISSFPSDLLEFVPATNADDEWLRATGLVETSPLDTLRLALQSIDSWRKVAEGALQALEGEGK